MCHQGLRGCDSRVRCNRRHRQRQGLGWLRRVLREGPRRIHCSLRRLRLPCGSVSSRGRLRDWFRYSGAGTSCERLRHGSGLRSGCRGRCARGERPCGKGLRGRPLCGRALRRRRLCWRRLRGKCPLCSGRCCCGSPGRCGCGRSGCGRSWRSGRSGGGSRCCGDWLLRRDGETDFPRRAAGRVNQLQA